MPELILASTSPRRRELLKRLGRPFRVLPPHADESIPPNHTLSPQEIACELARRKARSVAARLPAGWVLAADTLVSVGREIIGKPRDHAHAADILRKLSRRPHRVITGLCIIDAASGAERTAADTTRVTMRPMTQCQIDAYVASGEAMGKAGAYAIQHAADQFVQHLDGSLANVIGLPIELLRRMLDDMPRAADHSPRPSPKPRAPGRPAQS